MEWINVILQGVLVGGLYAMFAAGLSLIFGIMRLVNIAHGDLIVLAAYVALVDARRNLSDAEAAALDTKLVLILANHIGDLDVLNEAIALAREPAGSSP